MLGYKVNISPKLIDNKFTDHQPKPHSLHIDLLLLVLDGTKHVKQPILILLFDANARVHHHHPYLFFEILDEQQYFAISICKLEGIRHQVEYHLLQSFFVCFYEVVGLETQKLCFNRYVF